MYKGVNETLLVLAETLALPPHLLQQPEAEVGGAELRVDGRLLQPLRVQVLRRPVAHRQPELLQIVLVVFTLRLLPWGVLAVLIALLLSTICSRSTTNQMDLEQESDRASN